MNTPWISDRKPTTSDLPIWASRHGVVDIYFYSLPVEEDAWMPAQVPEPPEPKEAA